LAVGADVRRKGMGLRIPEVEGFFAGFHASSDEFDPDERVVLD